MNIKNCDILNNVSLKNFCTIKVGGKAKLVLLPHSITALINACKYCKKNNIKFKVIGLGANIIFSDKFFDGCIIVNKSSKIKFDGNLCLVDSGVPVSKLINKCYVNSLSNLENLSGIPATCGGAVLNNLGAFDCSFGDYVKKVECYDFKNLNKKIVLNNEQCKFAYRDSIFKHKNLLITKILLNLKTEEKSIIKEKIAYALNKKISTQPMNCFSAGSVFKRKENCPPPAKMIDDLNLKGKSIGGAIVSTKHAGFIINYKNAKYVDIKKLVGTISRKIKKTYNIELEPEIEFFDQ